MKKGERMVDENKEQVEQRESRLRATLERGRVHAKTGARLTVAGLIAGAALVLAATLLEPAPGPHRTTIVSPTEATSDPSTIKGEWHRNVTQIDAPENLTIFGERMPLQNWDIRERFEREFYYNYQNADQLVLWWKRGQRHFEKIDRMLEEAGLPRDLKYLMIAESGVRNVESPAKASGFWQFIPGTGTRFGLRVDNLVDERLDPVQATNAAISYFKSLKSEFPTWTLVAAAYNMGEANVRQVMEYQKQRSYWNIYVNEETMRYVFRIAAIKELMEHGEKYGLTFERMKPFEWPETRTETVQGPVSSIADWALSQGSSYKDVKVLNPWIIGRSLPAGTWRIELPKEDDDKTTVDMLN